MTSPADQRTRARGTRSRLVIALASMAIAATGIGIANAQIPDTNTSAVHGCYSTSGGALRVIDYDAGQRCTATERSLTWSHTTPQGQLQPVRAPLGDFKPVAASTKASNIMVAQDSTRVTGWNAYTSVLRETRDEGATWVDVHTFSGQSTESVTPLANGELLVSTTDGKNQRRMYVSSGYPSLKAGATWTQVLSGSSVYVKFTSAWSISTHENIVVVNEYGPKAGETWAGSVSPIPEGKNARYTYLSLDYGKTWRTIFDLNAHLSALGRTTNGQHLHGVAWDPWWDRIWISFGDNYGGKASNGILYSDDLGASWKTAHFYSGPAPYSQVVGIVPMPGCILFAGDMEPSGIMRIDRSQGKDRSTPYQLATAYDHPDTNMKHLGQAISYTNRVGDDPVALFGFGAEGTTAPSFILATFDGYNIRKVWQDSSPQAAGYGIRNIVGPTLRGNMIVASNDQRVAGMWTQWKGKALGY
ncbi:MAG TPA: hypothetical protein VIQ76_10685 [Propionibacteriaceae bacterium]